MPSQPRIQGPDGKRDVQPTSLHKFVVFCQGTHKRLGEKSLIKDCNGDILRTVYKHIQSWDASCTATNVTFLSDHCIDIHGGLRATVVATNSFKTGVHYWEVTAADFRTLCIGVCEKPQHARQLNEKWLGELGYAVCVSACSRGTAFLWSKEQLSTTTMKGFGPKQRVGMLLDMEERCLEYYLDGQKVATAFQKLPSGPLYPACSNGFDKAFCRRITIEMEMPIPKDYWANRDTRRAERVKAEAQASANKGAASGATVGTPGGGDGTAGLISAPTIDPTTGVVASAADVIMKSATPTPGAAQSPVQPQHTQQAPAMQQQAPPVPVPTPPP